MKIVIPGGTGQVGSILARAFRKHDVVILSRSGGNDRDEHARHVRWDGKTLDDWADEIDGADVVINLAGRTVSCRYTAANLREMMDSRVDSARVVGEAINQATNPPATWLQMSTATIYAHRFDAANDEYTGIIGGHEPDVPDYWAYSVRIAQNWERELANADTPRTRKVALRAAMVMSPDRGGVFDVLSTLVKMRLGGPVGGGDQYVSWIHERDLVRAIQLVIDDETTTGAVNLAAPDPLPQKDFMRILRQAYGVRVGLPATKLMAEAGALALRSDTELLLKSRRVVPARLLDAGFVFDYPLWTQAAKELATR